MGDVNVTAQNAAYLNRYDLNHDGTITGREIQRAGHLTRENGQLQQAQAEYAAADPAATSAVRTLMHSPDGPPIRLHFAEASSAPVQSTVGTAATAPANDHDRFAQAIDRLGQTAWGRANPGVVQHLREMLAAGQLQFSDHIPAENGQQGDAVSENGRIMLHSSLRTEPEAMMAFLAHEGTHAGQPANMSTMEGERAAYRAQVQVWGEVGAGHSNSSLDSFQRTYRNHGEVGIDARIAQTYYAQDSVGIEAWLQAHPAVNQEVDRQQTAHNME